MSTEDFIVLLVLGVFFILCALGALIDWIAHKLTGLR